MKSNSSLIPVKIRKVRTLAQNRLNEQRSRYHRDINDEARKYIAHIKEENKGKLFFFFEKKPLPVPPVKQVIEEWTERWNKGVLSSTKAPESEVYWIMSRTQAEWWTKITQLSKLPENQNEDTMYLSVADAELIKYFDTSSDT
jgi:hypothetical protein